MKKYVKVIAEHDIDGKIRPLVLYWEGLKLSVDRIIDIRQAASLKAGGQGLRYTCRICGNEVYMFCDDGCWFVEV